MFSPPCVDSGVGAGIDSYYEYLMKAYILLGDNVYLERFNTVGIALPHFFCFAFAVISVCNPSDAVCVCARLIALQCHNEVHQPAAPAAQRAHAQPHGERAQLDGLPARLLPWATGQQVHSEVH